MKNFASNTAVKVICVILTPILSFFAIFSIMAIITNPTDSYTQPTEEIVYLDSSNPEIDYRKEEFLKTDRCKNLLENDAYYICSLFAYNENVEPYLLREYSVDNSNLQVVVYKVKDNTYEPIYYNNRIAMDSGLSTEVYMDSAIDADTQICVKLALDRGLTNDDKYKSAYESYYFISSRHTFFIMLAVVSSLLFFAALILLCAGVGRRKNSGAVTLNFYNRIPIEIILAFYILLLFWTARLMSTAYTIHSYDGFLNSSIVRTAIYSIPPFLILNILLVPFIVSMAARIKASTQKVLPFWKNFLILRLIYFGSANLLKAAKFIIKNSSAVFSGALGFIVYIVVNLILIASGNIIGGLSVVLCIAFNICVLVIICLFLSNLDRLRKETQDLERGEYTASDNNSYLLFFRKFSDSLNHAKEGMAVALEKSLKSERLKTELITNVSHDLKTPLTSIINYVDLLKAEEPDSPKSHEYLEILDKQSKRLKHLIEDLIEVSKATTGNIKVQLSEIDTEEFLSQVTGEFFDRLESAELTPVISHSQKNLKITADGTLLWRVFNNLFSNICKYSMAGTRVYITTCLKGGNVEITVKNISAQPLNITASELTERFVRGDSSRNTEGSGLGLSIAKSLTESQKGTFEINIDGDLFKVIMTFPKSLKTKEAPYIEDVELIDETIKESETDDTPTQESSVKKDFSEDEMYKEIYSEDIWKMNGF